MWEHVVVVATPTPALTRCGGQVVPVVAVSELRSFKQRRAAEALLGVTRAAAMAMAASRSRLPEYPNVFADREEGVKDSEYERLYDCGDGNEVDLTKEDGRGLRFVDSMMGELRLAMTNDSDNIAVIARRKTRGGRRSLLGIESHAVVTAWRTARRAFWLATLGGRLEHAIVVASSLIMRLLWQLRQDRACAGTRGSRVRGGGGDQYGRHLEEQSLLGGVSLQVWHHTPSTDYRERSFAADSESELQ